MKTEKEIKDLIASMSNLDEGMAVDNMVVLTERGGHWIDALEWVLGEEQSK